MWYFSKFVWCQYHISGQDILKLAGEDYQKWGDDDSYITAYVLSHYGFVLE